MIEKLSASRIPKLESCFYKIFESKDPFEDVFTREIERRILLFPTDGYYLNEEQFNALIEALRLSNEREFFISEIEGDCFTYKEGGYKHGHWLLDTCTSYEEYRNLTLPLENAIYSIEGTWGVIISHEEHAVLGGSSTLINSFKNLFTDWSACKQEFLRRWHENNQQYNTNIDWLPDFLVQFE